MRVAFPGGSVAEVIDPGDTRFIVDDIDGAVVAVADATRLDRGRVRARLDRRVSVQRMARNHASLRRRMLAEHARSSARFSSRPRCAGSHPGA